MSVERASVDELVEAVAVRVAELLDERSTPAPWLDADAVARLLNVDRSFVYEHAAELGARRLGEGPKARLRFRLEDVEAAIPCVAGRGSQAAASRTAEPKRAARRRARSGTGAPLLPIRGSRHG